MKIKISILLIFAIQTVVSQKINIPPSIKICLRNSSNLANCVKKSIEYIQPYLKTGQLGNGFTIEPLEPVNVDDINVEIGKEFYFNMRNIKSYGVLDFKVEKLRVNLENLEIEMISTVPYQETTCNYKIKMQFGVINIFGEGKCICYQENVKSHVKAKLALYTDRNGVEYAKFVSAETKIKVGNNKFVLENLFKDKVLNDLSNDLINQNSHLFFDEIEKRAGESVSKLFIKIGNQIIQKIPFKILFS